MKLAIEFINNNILAIFTKLIDSNKIISQIKLKVKSRTQEKMR